MSAFWHRPPASRATCIHHPASFWYSPSSPCLSVYSKQIVLHKELAPNQFIEKFIELRLFGKCRNMSTFIRTKLILWTEFVSILQKIHTTYKNIYTFFQIQIWSQDSRKTNFLNVPILSSQFYVISASNSAVLVLDHSVSPVSLISIVF